jgi:hypothetical protein
MRASLCFSLLPVSLFACLLFACSSAESPPEPERDGELVPVPPPRDRDDDDDDRNDEAEPEGDAGDDDDGGVSDGGEPSDDEHEPDPDVGPACGAAPYRRTDACPDAIGKQHCSEGVAHREQGSAIDWQSNPPHSGPHYPAAAGWGSYEEPAPRGAWVHSLEHGAIVLLYNCESGCDSDIALFGEVMAERSDARIVLTPDPELEDSRFAAVSWTWVYETDELDLETLLCFVDQHEGNAPENVF